MNLPVRVTLKSGQYLGAQRTTILAPKTVYYIFYTIDLTLATNLKFDTKLFLYVLLPMDIYL